jgi:hypothetical protein
MITVDDVRDAHPGAAKHPNEKIDLWVEVANIAIDEQRVKDPRTLATARMLFVMHQLEKPALDLNARHVVTRVRRGRRGALAPNPWLGTPHGERLLAAVRY